MTELPKDEDLCVVGVFDKNLKPTVIMKTFEEITESDVVLKNQSDVFRWLAGEYMTIPYWKLTWGDL